MFISFEGIDFCGKSTQISLLKENLESEGKEVMIIREPGGTEISEQIRKILLDKKNLKLTDEAEILLFSASRAQLVSEKIIPFLKLGNYVLSDRFYDSTTAYQGFGRGIDKDFVNAINSFVAKKAKPDLTFFLDIPVDLAISRQKDKRTSLDRIELGSKEFYEKIRSGYQEIAKMEKRFVTIDGSFDVATIHNKIMEHLKLKQSNEKK